MCVFNLHWRRRCKYMPLKPVFAHLWKVFKELRLHKHSKWMCAVFLALKVDAPTWTMKQGGSWQWWRASVNASGERCFPETNTLNGYCDPAAKKTVVTRDHGHKSVAFLSPQFVLVCTFCNYPHHFALLCWSPGGLKSLAFKRLWRRSSFFLMAITFSAWRCKLGNSWSCTLVSWGIPAVFHHTSDMYVSIELLLLFWLNCFHANEAQITVHLHLIYFFESATKFNQAETEQQKKENSLFEMSDGTEEIKAGRGERRAERKGGTSVGVGFSWENDTLIVR